MTPTPYRELAMAYISQSDKAIIAANVKPILAQYGVKGSLSIQHHSSIVLTLRSGFDFLEDSDDSEWFSKIKDQTQGYNFEVYDATRGFRPGSRSEKFFTEIHAAMRSAGWYDHSDISTDYFHTKYYISVYIGRWNKPYIVTAPAVAVTA
jgi:hypothetical protein